MSIISFKAVVIVILSFLPIVYTTLIPADKSQLNFWFNQNVGPLSSRKDSLDSDLCVAEANTKSIKVSADGKGDFKTITDAVNSIPTGNKNRVIIIIESGTYTENIKIDRSKPFITLYGNPNNIPTLVYDGASHKYGSVDEGTTLMIESDYFVGANLNIVTSAHGKLKGAKKKALKLGADKISFYNCKLHGLQNTLRDKGKHFFKDCFIEGTVDFLFGGGKSLYLNTETRVTPCDPMALITSFSRMTSVEELGYSFVHCSVTGIGAIAQLGLAKMAYPKIVFAFSELNGALNAQGWFNNHLTNGGTMYFGEFQNKGTGSGLFENCPFAKKLSNVEVKGSISLGFVEGSKWLLPLPKI